MVYHEYISLAKKLGVKFLLLCYLLEGCRCLSEELEEEVKRLWSLKNQSHHQMSWYSFVKKHYTNLPSTDNQSLEAVLEALVTLRGKKKDKKDKDILIFKKEDILIFKKIFEYEMRGADVNPTKRCRISNGFNMCRCSCSSHRQWKDFLDVCYLLERCECLSEKYEARANLIWEQSKNDCEGRAETWSEGKTWRQYAEYSLRLSEGNKWWRQYVEYKIRLGNVEVDKNSCLKLLKGNQYIQFFRRQTRMQTIDDTPPLPPMTSMTSLKRKAEEEKIEDLEGAYDVDNRRDPQYAVVLDDFEGYEFSMSVGEIKLRLLLQFQKDGPFTVKLLKCSHTSRVEDIIPGVEDVKGEKIDLSSFNLLLHKADERYLSSITVNEFHEANEFNILFCYELFGEIDFVRVNLCHYIDKMADIIKRNLSEGIDKRVQATKRLRTTSEICVDGKE